MYAFLFLLRWPLRYWLHKAWKSNRIINQYSQAADAGDAEAQFEIGILHQYGRGVPQDFD
jgi:TPR repeat protein